jgi:DNA-binding CsgD family transcriptional regulator
VSDLLERDPELKVIEDALVAASGGVGGAVLVEAPAGLGKSSLLGAARTRAQERGFTVLAARGRELERDFAFGVARQLFEARLRAERPAARRRLLQGSAGLAAELLGLEASASAPAAGAGAPYPQLHGLHWLAANLAERAPLALVVDDAHWVDELSLRFLAYLGARVHDLPMVLIVARRPGTAGADAALLGELAAEPGARVLRPAPLTEAATGRIVATRAPGAEPAFVAACHRATGGNPFLLGELLVALAQEGAAPVAASVPRVREIGPAPVSRAVYLALRALPPEATALARAVAVLGDGAAVEDVAALGRLSLEAAREAAGALGGAGVLGPADGTIAFAHPILGRAVYEELDATERAAAHRAAVRVLQAAGAGAERIAAHALKAGPGTGSEVVDVLRAAAAEALRRGAPRPAAAYLRRALEEPLAAGAAAEVLVDLGRAEAAAAEPGAADRLREAMAAIGGAPERRAELAAELGNLLHARGAFGEAAEIFDTALAALGPGATPLHQSLEAGWAAAALWNRAPVPEVRARIERLADRQAESPGRAERAVLAQLAVLDAVAGENREGAAACALRAWGDGAMLEDSGVDDPAIWAVTSALLGTEEWEALEGVLDAVTAAARRAGALLADATAGYVCAHRWMCLGAVGDALAEIDRTLEAQRHGWGTFLNAALWVRVRCLLDQGDVAAAAAAVERPGADGRHADGSALDATVLDARARVQLARNDPAAALATWRRAGDLQETMGVRNPAFLPWRSGAALAAARAGQPEEARRLADAEVDAARAAGTPRALGVALTARAIVERPPAAMPWLEEAIAVLERTPARLELARALLHHGTVLRVAGRRGDAREPLRRALDMADRCGAPAVAERARDELVAAGGRPRRTRMSGGDALTPSERRVAMLVASGLSNREAAEALFVTKKAVEFHLGNVYRKLDLSGRDELAGALAQDAEPDR